MLPDFVRIPGLPFGVLPPGIHWSSMGEVGVRFAINAHRKWLFEGFVDVMTALRVAGCRKVYLDGSYVTEKAHPLDFDGCWDPSGVDASMLDPVLLDFTNRRQKQKQKYRGEMFVIAPNQEQTSFLEFFQIEKNTGARKGIIGIEIGPGILQ